MIDPHYFYEREIQDVAEELGSLSKELTIRHQIPIILISHTQHQIVITRKTGINDLRGSSYIAQDT